MAADLVPGATGRDHPMRRRIRASAWIGGALAMLVFAAILSNGSPAGLVSEGPFSSGFFDAQAEALLDGRLDVPPDTAGLEGFEHDGKTYLYFGLVPSILRMPVAAFSDASGTPTGHLTQLSMLAALAVALWASTRLAWRARATVLGDRPVAGWEAWALGGFVAAVGLSSPLLFLASRPVVYHEVELWGTATALVAFLTIGRWWDHPTTPRLLFAGGAALIALHTRASTGGGALAALVLVVALALWTRRVSWRAIPALAAMILLPVLTYAAVNIARFDEPVAVPFEDQVQSSFDPARQAALEATDDSLFGPEFLPTAAATYLRPDGVRFQPLFPWITFRETTGVIGDAQFDTVDRSASLPVVTPLLVVLAAVGAVGAVRRWRTAPDLAMAVGGVAGLASTLTIAIVAHRYLADFTAPLVLLAALGSWSVGSWIAEGVRARRGVGVAALFALFAIGTVVGAALAIQTQRLLLLPERSTRLDFVAFQYDLHDRLGGGRPPAVTRTDDLEGSAGERGDVAIEGDCEALYWHDGTRWWPLELGGDRQWELDGRLDAGRTVLVTGPAWAVVAVAEGDAVHFAYEQSGEVVRRSAPRTLDDVDGRHLTVRLDHVNHEALVEVDGDVAMAAWGVDVAGPATPDPAWDADTATTPECDELIASGGRSSG